MRAFRPLRSLTLTAAVVAILAELGLGGLGQIPAWLVYPIALATGGAVLWIALALDVLARRGRRPDRKDVANLREMQGTNSVVLGNHAQRLDRHEQRLGRAEAHLRLLAADPALAQAEHDLDRAVARIETWEKLSEDIDAWNAAMARWSGIVAALRPDLALDPSPATEAETRTARAQLPPAYNFSSQDLKVALTYLVQRERILAAHVRVEAYRYALMPEDPKENLAAR